jgi:hypothetical protein
VVMVGVGVVVAVVVVVADRCVMTCACRQAGVWRWL